MLVGAGGAAVGIAALSCSDIGTRRTPHSPGDQRAIPIGAIRLDEEAFDEAIALAESCLAEVPDDAECFDLRSMARGRSGRLDVQEQEQCYSKRPHDFGCVQGLAQARIQQGRFAEARKLIERMRSLDPNNALVATMEAMVLDSERDRVAGSAAC
jgi:hypothetical protein